MALFVAKRLAPFAGFSIDLEPLRNDLDWCSRYAILRKAIIWLVTTRLPSHELVLVPLSIDVFEMA